MSSRNNKNKNNRRVKRGNPQASNSRINLVDNAQLMRAFPDTQLWNVLAEHEPRFGVTNSRDNKIYNVVQTSVARGIYSTSITGASGFAQNFQGVGVANFPQYAAVFDQFRIRQIEVWFLPQPGAFSNVTGTLYTVIDYDDSQTPTTEVQMNSYENVTVSGLAEGVYRRFRPHNTPIVFDSLSTPVSRPAINVVSEWLNAAYGNIPHYGFKALSSITGSIVNYDIKIRYWMQFRNPV